MICINFYFSSFYLRFLYYAQMTATNSFSFAHVSFFCLYYLHKCLSHKFLLMRKMFKNKFFRKNTWSGLEIILITAGIVRNQKFIYPRNKKSQAFDDVFNDDKKWILMGWWNEKFSVEPWKIFKNIKVFEISHHPSSLNKINCYFYENDFTTHFAYQNS